MTQIALIGAGGKMGVRLATNLKGSRFSVDHVENAPAGRERLLAETGLSCIDLKEAIARAEVILLAVPDAKIGKVAHEIIADVRPGTAIIVLDAAAPYAGELPARADVTYFITHPCHPSLFADEADPEVRKDYFGGVRAKQPIVCALMQGPESHYALCEEIARTIYGPVTTAHRCSLKDIAVLEPALSETVGIALCIVMREATEEAIRRGVPRDAAMDFMLGHVSIGLSIAFGLNPTGKLSDGAIKAVEEAKKTLFQPGSMENVFSDEAVMRSVKSIVDG
jgi:hypothetical protein